MASLSSCPSELFAEITKHVSDAKTLMALRGTCVAFRRFLLSVASKQVWRAAALVRLRFLLEHRRAIFNPRYISRAIRLPPGLYAFVASQHTMQGEHQAHALAAARAIPEFDIADTDDFLDPQLLTVVLRHRETTLALLLVYGRLDLQTRCSDIATPIETAVTSRQFGFAKLLIESNAALVDKPPPSGTYDTGHPLCIVTEMANFAMARFFVEHGASLDAEPHLRSCSRLPLSSAVRCDDNLALVAYFLEMGADPNALEPLGLSALHEACRKGSVDACQLLLSYGADPMTAGKSGKTALHVAAHGGHVAVCQALIDHRPDIVMLTANNRGSTPLHSAIFRNHVAVCDLLLRYGAPVNLGNRMRFAEMCVAVERCGEEMVELLLRAGCDVHTRDNHDHTPLQIAQRLGNKRIIQLIEQAVEASPPNNM
eukprot:jgi/Hompol1/2631/HPOL_006090-RA